METRTIKVILCGRSVARILEHTSPEGETSHSVTFSTVRFLDDVERLSLGSNFKPHEISSVARVAEAACAWIDKHIGEQALVPMKEELLGKREDALSKGQTHHLTAVNPEIGLFAEL